jgi:hypothetical protein
MVMMLCVCPEWCVTKSFDRVKTVSLVVKQLQFFEDFYEYIFKGKVFLVHDLKAHGELEVYFHTFFTTALDGSEWSVFDTLAMQK